MTLPAESQLSSPSAASVETGAVRGAARPFFKRRSVRAVLVLLGLGFATFWVWWYLAHFVFFNLHEIVPGQVYRSAQPSPEFLERLTKEKGLKSVLKFNSVKESDWSLQEEAVAKRLGLEFRYVQIGVAELPPKQDMVAMLDAIEHAPRPLLLHCKTGADRSGVAAVLVELHEGVPYEKAKADQLSLMYLHTGQLGRDVSDFFDQYEADRKADGKPYGTYEDVKDYVINEYYADFYAASFDPEPKVISGEPGDKVAFDVKVTNITRRPWSARTLILQMQIPGTGENPAVYPDVLASAPLPSYLPAGQSVTVRVPVEIPKVSPGLHRYTLDVSERDRSTFVHYGSKPGEVFLDVKGQ